MLYPRTEDIDGKETLIDESCVVGYREHLTNACRIVFVTGIMTGEYESHNTLLALDTISHDPIKMIITSPGGDLDSTFLFYDTMELIKSPIITIGRFCASAAAIILAAGSKRYLFPHAKVMLHLIAGQISGDIKDQKIQRKQMELYQNKVMDILLDCGVKKTRKELLKDMDRDFWLEPLEAVAYGLADEIISPEIWQDLIKEAG